MNPHILMVIDNQLNPGKYTQEQLDKNAANAAAALTAITALDAAADAYRAADAVEYWVNEYFLQTGENKDDYIKELIK